MYICKICGKEYDNRHAYIGHCSIHSPKRQKKYKDKEKKTYTTTCKYCGKKFDNHYKLGGHVVMCSMNPNSKNVKRKISDSKKNMKLDESVKKKISISMKRAHKENRAWNIGKSRWNNDQSYPEKFFSKVIENEFLNQEYETEYPISIYSFDFAWVKLKKAIEIDGDQHQRFKHYIERDKKKDKYAIDNGWKVLRISWKDMYNDPKKWIKIAYDFIHTMCR